MNPELIQTGSEGEFAKRGTDVLKEQIQSAILQRGQCILGLSGGSTPKLIYEALGKEKNIDWSKVRVFLVDERYGGDTNQFLIRSTLLKHANIPESHLVFPDLSLPIEQCIEKYAKDLWNLWREHLPDVITLGMGEDGHIASLFPPLSDDAMSDKHLALHTTTEKFPIRDRITLTLNPVAAAGTHIFFLKGQEKKRVWEQMMASSEDERSWPSKRILKQERVIVVAQW